MYFLLSYCLKTKYFMSVLMFTYECYAYKLNECFMISNKCHVNATDDRLYKSQQIHVEVLHDRHVFRLRPINDTRNIYLNS